jgi:hypothetical protein
VEWTSGAATAPSLRLNWWWKADLTGRVMRLCWTFGVSLEGKIESGFDLWKPTHNNEIGSGRNVYVKL